MRDELVPDDLPRRLAAVLRAAGYADDGVGTLLEVPRTLPAGAAREARLRRLAGGGARETLARLFAVAAPVDAGAAARALDPVRVDELAAAGLVAVDGDALRPLVRILPFQDLLLASDPDLPGEKPADFVTGLNPAAWTLAQLTIRRPASTTLDLGTGSGIQALLAARHSGRVTATDVNPRALAYLRLNARLNGVENVEPVEGSWLEPVRGRRFGLIVANPPYVISPEAAHVFKDSGLDADGASRLVVEQLPEHLEEGGVAQVLCNWVHAASEDWRAPLERWVRGRGVDALLLRYETFTPLEYATAWNASLGTDPEAFGAALDRWLAYDARLGIERIAWGHVVLRRRTGRNRVRAVEVPGGPSDGAGRQLERMLAAWDEPLDDDALRAAILRPVEGAELERRSLARDGNWTTGRARVTLAPTLGFAVPLDDDAAAVLAACDGETTVADAIARVGAAAGAVLPALQRLHRLGCVEPVGKSGAPMGVLETRAITDDAPKGEP